MDNFVKLFSNLVTPQLAETAANLVGEESSTVSTGLKTLAPILVGALSSKGSSASGAKQILDVLNQNSSLDNVLSNPAALIGGGESSSSLLKLGEYLLPLLLGNKSSGIIDALMSVAGLRRSSASSLLSLAAPLVMGLLKKTVMGQGLDATGLSNLLAGQKDFVQQALPAGLNLANLLDTSGSTTTQSNSTRASTEYSGSTSANAGASSTNRASTYTSPEYAAPPEPQRSGSVWRWLLPLLILGALAAWYLLNGRTASVQAPATDNAATSGGGAAVTGNAAVCESLNTINDKGLGIDSLTADTPVSEVKSALTTTKQTVDAIIGAAASITGINLDGLKSAIATVESVVNGLTGETVGSGLQALQDAVGGLTTATSSIEDAIQCQ